ncbi:hypothetical protein FOFC_01515 [Fusarium oxysporum]|nr:hypothetical protein FOFC_01515 [Fusarium oxysporum]
MFPERSDTFGDRHHGQWHPVPYHGIYSEFTYSRQLLASRKLGSILSRVVSLTQECGGKCLKSTIDAVQNLVRASRPICIQDPFLPSDSFDNCT